MLTYKLKRLDQNNHKESYFDLVDRFIDYNNI